MMSDDRAAFEADELRALAAEYGARREIRVGYAIWRFPAYVCAHCGAGVTPPLPDCPGPLAAHHATTEAQRRESLASYALVWWHHGRRQRTEYTTLEAALDLAAELRASMSGSPEYVMHAGTIVWRSEP